MVQADNIDSGISNSQLDNCSGRDHHSLAHLSKFKVTGPERLRVTIPHDETRLCFFDRPRRREAAGGQAPLACLRSESD
jgi:hypothetical protein